MTTKSPLEFKGYENTIVFFQFTLVLFFGMGISVYFAMYLKNLLSFCLYLVIGGIACSLIFMGILKLWKHLKFHLELVRMFVLSQTGEQRVTKTSKPTVPLKSSSQENSEQPALEYVVCQSIFKDGKWFFLAKKSNSTEFEWLEKLQLNRWWSHAFGQNDVIHRVQYEHISRFEQNKGCSIQNKFACLSCEIQLTRVEDGTIRGCQHFEKTTESLSSNSIQFSPRTKQLIQYVS